MSFNLHGFYQGCPVLEDLIASKEPNILMLQEYWLTPAKLCLFASRFTNYFSFGCSAMTTMTSRVEAGILHRRPYGGVMTLIKKDLRNITTTITVKSVLLLLKFRNVYLPCSGTTDRLTLVSLLDDLQYWCDRY